eukprot:5624611-Pleurochrysis_carterae.AAC.1
MGDQCETFCVMLCSARCSTQCVKLDVHALRLGAWLAKSVTSDRLTNRQIHTQKHRYIDGHTDRPTDKQKTTQTA